MNTILTRVIVIALLSTLSPVAAYADGPAAGSAEALDFKH